VAMTVSMSVVMTVAVTTVAVTAMSAKHAHTNHVDSESHAGHNKQ
jgi:hypothetical protein